MCGGIKTRNPWGGKSGWKPKEERIEIHAKRLHIVAFYFSQERFNFLSTQTQ